MPGLIVKVTSRKLSGIQKNGIVEVANAEAILQLRLRRREIGDGFAIIGVEETGNNRFVIMTARLNAITANQRGLRLSYLKVFFKDSKWNLPKGYAESWDFQHDGYEFLDEEKDVLSCLIRTPDALFRKAGPQLPVGFKWNHDGASNLVIEFDSTGQPVLHSRRSFEQQVLGCFNNYMGALGHVWLKMDGREFERAIKDLFETLGYQVEHSKPGGDGGVDLTLTKGDDFIGMDRYVVQCKNYEPARKVDAPVITQLQGAAANKRAQRGFVVTSSSFTQAARKAAEGGAIPIQLIDGTLLSTLILPRVPELPRIKELLLEPNGSKRS